MNGLPADPVRTVAVIGAGQRGRHFAARCVQAGFAVVLEDVLSSRLRQAAESIVNSEGEPASRLALATSVEDAVRDADVAIDFVPDELESKLEIFSLLDRMAPPRTVLCTPTALSITDLASCTYRADRCVALQLFDEREDARARLVRGAVTSRETELRTAAWLQALGFAVSVEGDTAEPVLLSSPARHA